MKIRGNDNDHDADVPMSPLIDCVFLLLIVFLATTMIKKFEKQIPVTLPDSTSAISESPNDSLLVISVDKKGNFFKAKEKKRHDGGVAFVSVKDISAYLKEQAEKKGTSTPVRIDVEKGTPAQLTIRAVDLCKLQGFSSVGIRIRSIWWQ